VLLAQGAAQVVAVDVGRGQLHWQLRQDPRVVVVERVNARFLQPQQVGPPVQLITVDVSFISLRLILPPLLAVLVPGGEILALVKPQFEVGKGQVGKGGVVRDEALREEAIQGVARFAQELGLELVGRCPAPIPGPAGNREEFLYLCKPLAEKSPQA
jgi:23S rRNA (cytidine1920-2'-O)/16S rRNA (cytidine1409-2'-O)-methyltransferase